MYLFASLTVAPVPVTFEPIGVRVKLLRVNCPSFCTPSGSAARFNTFACGIF